VAASARPGRAHHENEGWPHASEPDRGRRTWKKQAATRDAVYANRRRIRGQRGRSLQRRRSERLERPNAHLYETGGMRRTHLRGHANILKRVLVHVGGFNLGFFMRTRFGIGTPRSLQGAVAVLVIAVWTRLLDRWCEQQTSAVVHRPAFTYRRFELLPVGIADGGF
jgi:transposase